MLIAFAVCSGAIARADTSTPPAPSGPCACLWHIAIGDSIEQAYRVVQEPPPPPNISAHHWSEFDSYGGDVMVDIEFDSRVVSSVAISRLTNPHPRIGDPFGVFLGDSTDQLTSERGKPGSATAGQWTYLGADGSRWDYTIKAGEIDQIMVSRPIVPQPTSSPTRSH
jgi:hypothetical protein